MLETMMIVGISMGILLWFVMVSMSFYYWSRKNTSVEGQSLSFWFSVLTIFVPFFAPVSICLNTPPQ